VTKPAALQETGFVIVALWARKHNQAPFFPPVKWISPPRASDVGAAEIVTLPPAKREIAVFEDAALRVSLEVLQ
jgi:hypothetical protein